MASGTHTESTDSGVERRLAELVEDFAARQERGEQPDVESYVARVPDAADDLRDALEGLVALRSSGSGKRPSSADLSVLSPGLELGGYRIERELGRGGMGVVYEAVDLNLGRRVALKLLPPLAGLDPGFRERFRREARAAAKLRHPNIVPVHGEGRGDGLDFFVMQCIDGESLAQIVKGARDGSRADCSELAYTNVAGIGERVADALGHAHASGVLHRDVKPGNVMLDGRGHVWVTDFGLAKAEGADGLTMSGAMVGTLNYMAPEQVEGTSDVRSDVYGLGATLYELVTLQKPFDDTSRSGLVRRVLSDEPTRPRRLAPDVPRDLESIILKAMAKLPEHRYGTAAALADDLRAFAESRPVSARPPGFLHLARLAWRRQPLALSIVAAVLVVLPILGLLYLRSMNEARLEQRRRLYAAEIAAAEAARLKDPTAARQHLERAPAEYRDWEWRHLSASVDQSLGIVAVTPPARGQTLAASPDGRFAVGEKWVYLVEEGKEPVHLRSYRDHAYGLAFDATGERLAVSVGTGELEVWDVSAEPRVVAARTMPGTCREAVAFSADGRLLVTTDRDSRAEIVDSRSLETIHVLLGHVGFVNGAGLAPDGRHAYTAGADGTIRAWDVESGVGRLLCQGTPAIGAMAVGPEGRRIAFGTEVGTVGVVDVETGAVAWSSGVYDEDVTAVSFAGRGSWVVSSSHDGTLAVHDAVSGRHLRSMAVDEPVNDLCVSSDGVRFHSVEWDGTVRAWDVEATGGSIELFGALDDLKALAFSPDGLRLATGGNDAVVRVWDAQTGTVLFRGVGHRSAPAGLVWLPQRDRLATVGFRGNDLIVWDLSRPGATARVRPDPFPGPFENSSYVAAAALAGSEKQRLWVAVTGQGLFVLSADEELRDEATLEFPGLVYMVVSPDGRTVCAVEKDGTVHRIDADLEEPTTTFSTRGPLLWGASFVGEGEMLATMTEGEDVARCWRISDGAPQGTIEMGGRVSPFEYGRLRNGPSPRRLVYTAFARGNSLWDPDASQFVLQLRGLPLYIAGPAVHAERIACGDAEGVIRVWDTVDARTRRELLESERRTGRVPKGASRRIQEDYDWVLDEIRWRLGADTELRDWQTAAAMASGLNRLVHDDPAPLEALGEVYLKCGYPAVATDFLERAVTLQRAAGRPDEATQALLEQAREEAENSQP